MALVHQSESQRFETTKPYTVPNRRERSRELAQKRRTTYKSLMKDLADELPFSKDVVSQVDYNSRLRLALCFVRMKTLLNEKNKDEKVVQEPEETSNVITSKGMLQDLITESLDGFLLVAMGDGTITYISESIHKHLGLFQSEHIGFSLYDLVHEDDHNEVKQALLRAESGVLTHLSRNRVVQCSFFCRMKCSKFKMSNTATKSPGFKLVFVSGHFKLQGADLFIMAVVRPVSPPSILELRMEGNMFVTHYTLQMKCIFFDGRLRHLMGFEQPDLVGHVPFEFHHHDDVQATLECSRGLMQKGEGLSGYYRYMNKFGQYVWIQSRATMMFDSRTSKPSYIVCMNFVISKEDGEKDLDLRKALTAGTNTSNVVESSSSHDPFPIPREDGVNINPLEPENTPPVTPVESRSSSTSSPIPNPISPDLSNSNPNSNVLLTNQETDSPLQHNKHLSINDSDRGYGSVARQYHSPIISPHSVDSALGSDEESVSPGSSVFVMSSSRDPNDSYKSNSPLFSSSPTTSTPHSTLIHLLSTTVAPTIPITTNHSSPCTVSPTSISYVPKQPIYSNTHEMHNTSNQHPPVQYMPYPVSGLPQTTLATQGQALQYVVTNQSPYVNSMVYNMTPTAAPQIPTGIHQIKQEYSRIPAGQVPIRVSSGNPTMRLMSNTGFTATVLPQHGFSTNLPVLSVEDIQLLDSSRMGGQYSVSHLSQNQ